MGWETLGIASEEIEIGEAVRINKEGLTMKFHNIWIAGEDIQKYCSRENTEDDNESL